jgi:hypothetical protein
MGQRTSKLAPYIKEGIIRAPLKLESLYKGTRLTATVNKDGRVLCNGKSYTSLSSAAVAAKLSALKPGVAPKSVRVDGWIFWKYLDLEIGKLIAIDQLRTWRKRRGRLPRQ